MGNQNSGRKSKSALREQAERSLAEAAPHAAAHLSLSAQGSFERPNAIRIDACKYILNQVMGAPTQKTILAGDKEAPLQTFVFICPDGARLTAAELLRKNEKGA